MQPDTTRLNLGTGDINPIMSSAYNGGNSRSSQYTPRQIAVRDITKDFSDASAELRQGQLVKDDFFTLFEAVGALEIMDPKMDSGFALPEKDAAVDNFDPLQKMLPEEIIGIMDQLLSFEMAWHQGYALSQTVFTSLHMYSLSTPYYRSLSAIVFSPKKNSPEVVDPLVSSVLRAFCLGIIKSCDAVIQEITSEHYYEEEDFVTQTFTQYMLNDCSHDDVIGEIKKALGDLEKQGLSTDVQDALRCRLELRVHLLEALEPLTPVEVVDKSETWKAVLDSVNKVNDTTKLGKERPDLFSERVQRHLASNTPPIPMIKTSWEEAYPRFKRLAEDNIEAHRFASIENPSPLNVTRFAWDFSSRSPQPSTYSRSVMQGLLFKGQKLLTQTPHLSLILEDIRSLSMAGDPLLSPLNWEVELPTDPRYLSSRVIDEFMAKALDEYINIPRMILQNRCRMRRTFCQSVGILDGLQAEAENADAELHSLFPSTSAPGLERFYPLAAWAYFHKLRIMEWSIQLGFELDVYQNQEIAYMYRFLSFVAHTRAEHLQHIDLFLHLRMRKYKKQGNIAMAEQVATSQATIAFLTAQASCTAEFASALSSVYAVLMSLGLIKDIDTQETYSTMQRRHELRMKPYLPIGTPSLPSAEEMDASTTLTSQSSFSAVFTTISSRLTSAKTALSTFKSANPDIGNYKGCEIGFKAEVQGILGSIVATGITLALIKKVVEEIGVRTVADVQGKEDDVKEKVKVEVVAEKRFSGFWAVPKVVGN
ncbi:Mak10-domain-containing protein [Aureobasidium pullulans]|nr:Mak10-domain-containing protein [Aureobasidium pullulans]THZ93884.1 Mak10-domain-containing protein [Aureobasidium pullulans]